MTGPAFAAANQALFRDANMALDAVWKSGGAGGTPVSVRLIEAAPDEATDFGDTRLKRPVRLAYVPRNQAETIAAGDHLIFDTVTWRVMAPPMLDEHRSMFRLELGLAQ